MRQTKWLAIVGVMTILSTLWLATGGVVVYDYRWYGRSAIIPVRNGPRVLLSIDTRVRDVGIPFVYSYLRDEMPYSVGFVVYNDDAMTKTIVIDRLSLLYRDGRAINVITPRDRWARDFAEYTIVNSSPQGPIVDHLVKVEGRFNGAVDAANDVRVEISGRYVLQDGSVIEINGAEWFRVQTESRTTTGWNHIAAV